MSSWYAVERTSYSTLLFIFIWGMDAWNRTARIGEPSSMNMTFSCSKSTIVWYNSVFASKTIEILHISANLSDRNFLNPSRAYLYLFLFFFLSNIGFYHRIKFIITLLSLRSEIFYLFFFFHAVEFIGSRISCYLQLVQLGWLWLQLEECCLGKLSGILCPCWSWTHIEKSLLLQGVLGVLWLLGVHLIPVTLVIR